MSKKIGLMSVVALGLALAIGLTGSQKTVMAQASSQASVGSVVTTRSVPNALAAETTAAAALAYWTPERMAAAKEMSIDGASLGLQKIAAAAPAAAGTPGLAGGFNPATGVAGPTSGQVAQAARSLASPSGIVPLDGGFPGPNNTFFYGPKYVTFPISTVGKLFFTDPVTGGGFQCTASVTSGTASIQNIIWTAGHCVANGGQSYFYTNQVFCPSYNSGGVNPSRGCWAWNGSASVFHRLVRQRRLHSR